MTPQLCLADWDGTLSRGYTIITWMDFLHKSNIICEHFLIQLQNAFYQYKRGSYGYSLLLEEWAKIYAESLMAVKHDAIFDACKRFIPILEANLFDFTSDLLHLLSEHKIETVIISGAPYEPLFEYLRLYGIRKIFGLELDINDAGFYTGEIKSN